MSKVSNILILRNQGNPRNNTTMLTHPMKSGKVMLKTLAQKMEMTKTPIVILSMSVV